MQLLQRTNCHTVSPLFATPLFVKKKGSGLGLRAGRAIAHASHRGGRGSNSGHVMWDLWWKSGNTAGFLRVLRFLLPIRIPPIAP
jgi:hypothetical protein